jgi:hypothetical protein
MKITLLVVVLSLMNVGQTPIKHFDWGVAPSFEDCTKRGFEFVRKEIAADNSIKLDIMYCMELTEEESASYQAAETAAKKMYFLGL